ncbi:hypothetical protein AMECASPLE_014797 [Ameca splendens]|uniref:Uncharacterized protein n=1 Tax=Ameca splendens TaxID=208324 RepID=A0ABV0ZLL1_9TELE
MMVRIYGKMEEGKPSNLEAAKHLSLGRRLNNYLNYTTRTTIQLFIIALSNSPSKFSLDLKMGVYRCFPPTLTDLELFCKDERATISACKKLLETYSKDLQLYLQ